MSTGTNEPPVVGVLDRLDEAAPRAAEGAAGDTVQLIVVRIGERRYCAHLDRIRMIVPASAIACVPGAEDHVLGVMNWRGEIVPVIELERLLGIAGGQGAATARPMVMIALVDGVPTGVGCAIDELVDIWTRPAADIQPPLATFEASAARFVEGQLEDGGALIPVLGLGALAVEERA